MLCGATGTGPSRPRAYRPSIEVMITGRAAAAALSAVVTGAALIAVGLHGTLSSLRAGPTSATAGPVTNSATDAAGTAEGRAAATGDAAEQRAAVPADAVRRDEAALAAQLREYDDAGPAELAVTIVDDRTGSTFRYRSEEAFETASVVKVEILAALLLRAQRAGRPLDASERALAEAMITRSDNDAASELWDEIGGASGLRAASTSFGLTSTEPDGDGAWGLTVTSADDQARLLGAVAGSAGPLTAANAAYLFGLMREVVAEQAWGVGSAPRAGEWAAVKNGWLSGTWRGGWTINSVGRITGDHGTATTIAVLTHGNTTMANGIDLVERIVAVSRRCLGW